MQSSDKQLMNNCNKVETLPVHKIAKICSVWLISVTTCWYSDIIFVDVDVTMCYKCL